jgi:hypothetical protein
MQKSTPELRERHIAIAYAVADQKILGIAHEEVAKTESFSPGSLMKVPSLLYLLAAGKLDTQYTYQCTGRYYPRGESTTRDELIHEDIREPLPGQWYKCGAVKGHGRLTPAEAIAHSCNHFFMSLHASFESAGELRNFAAFCELYGLEQIARRVTEIANTTQRTPNLLCTRDRLHLMLGLPFRATVFEMMIFFARVLKGDIHYPNPERFEEARQIILEGMRLASSVGTARNLGFHKEQEKQDNLTLLAPPDSSPLVPERVSLAPLRGLRAGGAHLLLAKTGTGLVSGSIFQTNGWCVSAWPADTPRILLISFVRESYGAGLPLVCSRYFWLNLFSLSAALALHSSE